MRTVDNGVSFQLPAFSFQQFGALLVRRRLETGNWKPEAESVSYNLMVMRIAIGADHAGFPLKQHLIGTIRRLGHEIDDCGTHSEDPVDYPPICAEVARRVAAGMADRGVVLGGSGQGEQIAANKVLGIRAALCNDLYTARVSRQHNDANVLSMGGRIVGLGLADEIITSWLSTSFEGGRHAKRLQQIADIEREALHIGESLSAKLKP
jgi:ribose 5-phosphate isomerase B